MHFFAKDDAPDRAPPVIAVPVDEAARLCGIGRTKLYQFVMSGELKSARVGTRRVVLVEDLREWLRGRESPPGE